MAAAATAAAPTLTDVLEGRVALVGVTPRSFLDHFGRGLGATIPFGRNGFNVGWAKAPIGRMFDLLRLDKGQRKVLWADIGPDTTFHRTQKDATWGCWPARCRTPSATRSSWPGRWRRRSKMWSGYSDGDASDGVRDRPIGSIWLPALPSWCTPLRRRTAAHTHSVRAQHLMMQHDILWKCPGHLFGHIVGRSTR
jgi:hypothetical protein